LVTLFRKWHNWKQYNKARKKPHPFVVCGNIAVETVIEKCAQVKLPFFLILLLCLNNNEFLDWNFKNLIDLALQLCDQARADPEFAALLARGPIEAIDTRGDKKRSTSESDNPIEDIVATKYSNGQIGRILKRDFIVRKTGNKVV